MLEHPSIPYAERYGVGTISRKGSQTAPIFGCGVGESSETSRHGSRESGIMIKSDPCGDTGCRESDWQVKNNRARLVAISN